MVTGGNRASKSPITLDVDDVLVLDPVIMYERIDDEQPLSSVAFGGEVIQDNLFLAAKHAVRSGKLKAIEPKSIDEADESELLEKIAPMIPKLSYGVMEEKTTSLMKSIYSDSNPRAILVNYVRVKVGSGGSWNPNSGAITSSNSKSIFNAALIQGNTAQCIWRRQVFLRNIPNLADEKYFEALTLLYEDFPRKEGE